MSAWTYRYQSTGKATQKIVPLRPRTPCWKGLSADSEEKREPVSDINTALVDSLKALDSKRPIREADVTSRTKRSDFVPRQLSLGGHVQVQLLCGPILGAGSVSVSTR